MVGYGRRSNHIEFQIEVDRTAPEFAIETNGAGDPPMFNSPFEITVWTDDHTGDHVMVEIFDSEGGITPVDMIEPVPPWDHAREWKGTHDQLGMPLPEGAITIQVTLFDDLGNQLIDPLDAWIDTIPPEVVIISPTEGEMWNVGVKHVVYVDISEDQALGITISEVRVVLRCMENLTEAVNMTLPWNRTSFFDEQVSVPLWASIVVPWMIEVYAVDTAGNVGSTTRSVILSDP